MKILNKSKKGDMELATSYRDNFIKYENSELVSKVVPKNNDCLINSDQKKTISGITQTRADFVHYPNHIPSRPAECNPFISNLKKDIYPNNNHDHNTIYSSEFIPKELTKQKSCKKEEPPYEKPIEKFETETTTHVS